MWELERTLDNPLQQTPPQSLAIVGRGRMGSALACALRAVGFDLHGPLPRGAAPVGVDVVLICVPDAQIAAAAALIPAGPLVAHCSGATGLDVLSPHEAFSLHPLMMITGAADATGFHGAGAAVDGTTSRALAAASALARALGLRPVQVTQRDRAAYHAAASIASNFLVTLEAAAEQLAESCGVDRSMLVPLVRATVENWARLGPRDALTGPVARGDELTIARQREQVAERTGDLLPLFDALLEATRRLAAGRVPAPARRPLLRPPAGAGMKTVRSVSDLRAQLARPRRQGRSIGLVPTMGAFHEGHLSLIQRAREQCELVVVSLFVNPTQFNDAGDLDLYPRDERRDERLAREAGVDLLFAPPVDEVYPPGFATSVSVSAVSAGLESAHRGRAHFDGVATVVAKLFNMVGPDVAYFGQKDAQQVAVVRRLARDLDLPLRVAVCPTVRAADGLALSSRNVRLSPEDRERAPALHRALEVVRSAILDGERDPEAAVAAGTAELEAAGIAPEYLELVSAETMAPLSWIDDGEVLAVVAARVGETRLIDNTPIQVLSRAGTPAGSASPGRS